jgi:outer membrane protein assembly factor BamB
LANTIRIANNEHYLDKVIKQGGAGPTVSININEINSEQDNDISAEIDHSIVIKSDKVFIDNGNILFYKQHGKYTIVLGKETAAKAIANPKFNNVLTGHLISTVVLKKCRV